MKINVVQCWFAQRSHSLYGQKKILFLTEESLLWFKLDLWVSK